MNPAKSRPLQDHLVDPHHHLCDAERFTFHGHPPTPPRYLLDDFLADARGLHLIRLVHVQAEVGREAPIAETRWLQSIADEHGFPHGIVAYANLADPDLGAVLARHAASPNLRGIRQILNWTQCDRPDYLTDPVWEAGFALLGRRGLSFDAQVFPEQTPDLARVAAAHPDTPVILNHAGMPRLDSADCWDTWSQGMRRLAGQRAITVKLSGFGMFAPPGRQLPSRPS